MTAPVDVGSVLRTINGSRVLEQAIETVARTPRPPIRWLRDEPCESCNRRTRVAIFDGAAVPCPRICADCMRAALGEVER